MKDLNGRDFEVRNVAAAGAGLLIGAGLGAGLMYLFDPDRGRSRRAKLEAQAGSLCRHAEQKTEKVAQDLANRAEGVAAEVRHMFTHEAVEPARLEARVRAKMGRVIRKPHGLSVHADDAGKVTLEGDVEARDAGKLLAGVMGVPGVRDVDNRLHLLHDTETSLAKGAGAIASVAGGLITYAGLRALKRVG